MIKGIVATVLALVVFGFFFFTNVGKPISSDLSIIGQGKPVLALAYENFSPTGGDALTHLQEIKNDYDSRLSFVIADLGTPQGRTIADRYRLRDGLAVFLDKDGQALLVTNIPADQRELRSILDNQLTSR
ncbi:MAG: hypothetical protein AB8B79_03335 [Granulosicoccus sp.]